MEYTTLGRSLRVSRIAMGCEPLGGTDWGRVDVTLAEAAVSAAVEAGINFFDTADAYGLGLSEERLSKTLGQRRHELVIASKVGVRWHDGAAGARARTYRDSSAGYVQAAVEASLRRLRLETLPLVYIHWPDHQTPFVETFAAMNRLKAAGKVQHVAVSNFSSQQIKEAHDITPLAAVQVEYNFLNRAAEAQILPACRALDVPVVAYGPLAQGILTGKFRADASFGADDRRARLPHFHGEAFEAGVQAAELLRRDGLVQHLTAAQMALNWVLRTPGIACAVVGAKTPEQVRHNVAACDRIDSGIAK